MHVGVAGYMGAGKSEFCAVFARAGYTVIDADAEAKAAMAADAGTRAALGAAFGAACVPGDSIDSRSLGAIVFSSAAALRRFNEIIRPKLATHFESRIEALNDTDAVLDAAMMPLWELPHRFDRLFWVQAPFTARLARLAAKYGGPTSIIEARMRLQETIMPAPAETGWIRIVNDGNQRALGAEARAWVDRLAPHHGKGACP